MWEIHTSDQAVTFLLSVALGAVLCLFYDSFRALRKVKKHTVFAVFFEDIIFWIISAFVTFVFLLSKTHGEIRGYVLFAALMGFLLCRITLSLIWFALLVSFFKIICNVWGFVKRLNDTVLDFSEHFFLKIYRFIKKNLKITVKTVKKLLKNIHNMLYTKRNKNIG